MHSIAAAAAAASIRWIRSLRHDLHLVAAISDLTVCSSFALPLCHLSASDVNQFGFGLALALVLALAPDFYRCVSKVAEANV